MSSNFQPIDDLQLEQLKVEWVPRSSIKPNKYNPNRMTPQDRKLLLQSLLEDGWTQPIVTLVDQTIVDGEQRWTTSGIKLTPNDIQKIIDTMNERIEQGAVVSESIMARLHTSKERLAKAIEEGHPPCLASITGGLVPITRVDFTDEAHRMISTIRHNRARGSHLIDSMSSIVGDLRQLGLNFDDLQDRLGMSTEEATRLLETNTLAERFLQQNPAADFSPAKDIKHHAELPEEERDTPLTPAVDEKWKAYAEAQKHREEHIRAAVDERAKELAQTSKEPVTIVDKEKIERQVRREVPEPPKPNQAAMRLIRFYVTVEQYEDMTECIGDDVRGFLELIYAERARRGYTTHRWQDAPTSAQD